METYLLPTFSLPGGVSSVCWYAIFWNGNWDTFHSLTFLSVSQYGFLFRPTEHRDVSSLFLCFVGYCKTFLLVADSWSAHEGEWRQGSPTQAPWWHLILLTFLCWSSRHQLISLYTVWAKAQLEDMWLPWLPQERLTSSSFSFWSLPHGIYKHLYIAMFSLEFIRYLVR